MRIIAIIVRKEFLQISRNRMMLPMIFLMPIIQLLILSNAATFNLRNIRLGLIDRDHSSASRLIARNFQAAGSFVQVPLQAGAKAGLQALLKDDADVVIEIPHHFESNLVRQGDGHMQVLVNAIDGAAAAVESSYTAAILERANRRLIRNFVGVDPPAMGVTLNPQFWFNPELNYQTFMVPGILVMLVTMVSLFLAGMNIVREKEIGTIEQLNVTPIRKTEFIIGKLLPFWLIGLLELAVGLVVAKLVFAVPMVGSLWLIFLFAAVYLISILGIGLFASTLSDTQQQAMFISWFFMVLFILLSGLFTPIESMPHWAQVITWFNPIAYFVRVIRMVMLKGSGFAEIRGDFIAMLVAAVVINAAAIASYRKQV